MKKIFALAFVFGMVSCSVDDPMDDLMINQMESETSYQKKTTPKDTVIVPENVIIEKWDSLTFNEILTDNTRELSIDWVKSDTNGIFEREHFEILLPRELTALTNWTSVQKSYEQTTSELISQLTSRDTLLVDAREDGDAIWKVTLMENAIGNTVSLLDSAEVNVWYARECENVTLTYKGETYAFPIHSVAMSEVSSVDADGKYSDELTYTYGENMKKSVAPGTIILYVEPVIEPDTVIVPPVVVVEPVALEQTVAPSKDKKSYFYTLIVRYSDDTMLPMVIDRDGNVTTFDKVANDNNINGLSLNRAGEWVLTKAEDAAENITYVTTDGKMNCQMSYTVAETIGWDENHMNGTAANGSKYCSVKTYRYSLSGEGVLLDHYTGATIAF